MLGDAERKGFETTVAWQPCGRAFKVNDAKAFAGSIMPRYFNQTQYKSFQRQLNIYGFRRIAAGSTKGAYAHDLFIRGRPDICRYMVRTKVKSKGYSSSKAVMATRGIEDSKLCRRTASCPETLRMVALSANTVSMGSGTHNSTFKLFEDGYEDKCKQEPAELAKKSSSSRRIFRRRSMELFKSTLKSLQGLPTEELEDPMDLDSIFEEPTEKNRINTLPEHREIDPVEFRYGGPQGPIIEPDVADEIIRLFS
jgi:hypothetical protein